MRQDETALLSIPSAPASAPGAGPKVAGEPPRALLLRGAAGWLHLPPEGVRRSEAGVVLCAPLGRDARCAHRPMRLFAERLARAGHPVLRYDHPGQGDGADLAPDIDALPEWIACARLAVARLRAEGGGGRIVLGGVRFGATLAALAAAEDPDVDGLLLLAPIASGRGWIRELRLSGAVGERGAPLPDDIDALDADGLDLCAATAASLAAIDLSRLPSVPGRALLAAAGPSADRLAAAMEAAGSQVTREGFPGFEALFQDSHSNAAPPATFAAAADWLAATFPGAAAATARPAPPAPVSLHLPGGAQERPVRFGDGLQGVLCRPQDGAPDGRAVLFCNTGGEPRAGIGRFAVQAARRLAAEGVASLRFDFAGLGDSPAAAGADRSHVYETPRGPDIAAALTLLRGEGLYRITIAGVCSGAYHAVHAAIADERIEGVFAVNPVKLLWRAGEPLEDVRADRGRATRAYLLRARDPGTWRRLATGRVDVAVVGRALGGRVLARLRPPREADAHLLVGMKRLAARGGRMCLLSGLDDPSLDEIEARLGRGGAKLRGAAGFSLQVEPALDHGLTRRASRARALAALSAWLAAAR